MTVRRGYTRAGVFMRAGKMAVFHVRQLHVLQDMALMLLTCGWASGVVHENELRVAAFVQTKSSTQTPCTGVR